MDLERLERINSTVGVLTAEQRLASGIALKPIETLVIAPSQRLDYLATRHRAALPRALRLALRGLVQRARMDPCCSPTFSLKRPTPVR
jgi:NTE family protein